MVARRIGRAAMYLGLAFVLGMSVSCRRTDHAHERPAALDRQHTADELPVDAPPASTPTGVESPAAGPRPTSQPAPNGPTNHRPAPAGEPGPIEPGPIEPGPVEPGPVEPGPVDRAAEPVPNDERNSADPNPPSPNQSGPDQSGPPVRGSGQNTPPDYIATTHPKSV